MGHRRSPAVAPRATLIDKVAAKNDLWMTRPILVDSCRLPLPFHGDPADRIIVATTRAESATLMTRDSRLQDYAHVRTAWS